MTLFTRNWRFKILAVFVALAGVRDGHEFVGQAEIKAIIVNAENSTT